MRQILRKRGVIAPPQESTYNLPFHDKVMVLIFHTAATAIWCVWVHDVEVVRKQMHGVAELHGDDDCEKTETRIVNRLHRPHALGTQWFVRVVCEESIHFL